MTYLIYYDKVIRHRKKILSIRRLQDMAKKITSKKPLFGNRRSHSLRATKHAQKPNLQKVTLDNGEKIIMSARELRTLNKMTKVAEKVSE